MSNDTYKYYTDIKVSITGKELRSIPSDRYDEIEKQAYEDVKSERKARAESEFKTNAEYKSYLLNLVDFASKLKSGVTPTLGGEQ